ncbi:MAG: acyltransferase [Armatimonadetes bacterium]|nr:acyltransferase [Armatimonadota bacterium]
MNAAPQNNEPTNHRVQGLDSIRFVCALWVLFRHSGGPFPGGNSAAENLVQSAFMGLISGQAAVIVFFVISGFCIHYPFRHGRVVDLPSFYSRRLVRIALPVLAMFAAGYPLGFRLPQGGLQQTVLWSIVAEVIYYILYPIVLLPLSKRFNWTILQIASFGITFLLLLVSLFSKSYVNNGNYIDFGIGWTWLLGLPCWILGCVLASRSDVFLMTPKPRISVWAWRFGAIVLSASANLLRWHNPLGFSISYTWSLTLFSIYVYFWLANEIIYYKTAKPNAFLESAGLWSYSLYLFHVPSLMFLYKAVQTYSANQGGAIWLTKIALVLLFSFVFYKLFEAPSQQLATWIGKKLSPKPTVTA